MDSALSAKLLFFMFTISGSGGSILVHRFSEADNQHCMFGNELEQCTLLECSGFSMCETRCWNNTRCVGFVYLTDNAYRAEYTYESYKCQFFSTWSCREKDNSTERFVEWDYLSYKKKTPTCPEFCFNGASCKWLDKNRFVVCSCPSPYLGEQCQQLPCDFSVCDTKGNCSVTKTKPFYKCTCQDTGKEGCYYTAPTNDRNSYLSLWIFSALGGVALIVGVFFIVRCLYEKSSSKQQESTYAEDYDDSIEELNRPDKLFAHPQSSSAEISSASDEDDNKQHTESSPPNQRRQVNNNPNGKDSHRFRKQHPEQNGLTTVVIENRF